MGWTRALQGDLSAGAGECTGGRGSLTLRLWVAAAPRARRTKLKCRLEGADGVWVERIPAWIKFATQVSH